MAPQNDPANLFAVPDFNRPSPWLDPLSDVNKRNPLFSFDVAAQLFASSAIHSTDPETPVKRDIKSLSLLDGIRVLGDGPDDDGEASSVNNDDHVFFKLPPLLGDLGEPGRQKRRKRTREVFEEDSESIPDTEVDIGPAVDSVHLDDNDDDDDDDDLWLTPTKPIKYSPQFKTWETFPQQPDGPSSLNAPLFITEAGPSAFDALLASHALGDEPSARILPTHTYISSLLSLALGRSSILFHFDSNRNSFVKTSPHIKISGVSLSLLSAVDMLCLECGNATRHLLSFAEATYSPSSSSSSTTAAAASSTTPTKVALAGMVNQLVTAIRAELGSRGREARSLVQLQAVVQPARSLLVAFKALVAKLAQAEGQSDEEMLGVVFEEAQAAEYKGGLLREVMREVLGVLSRPWLEWVGEWIGIRMEEGIGMSKERMLAKKPGRGFVKTAKVMVVDDQGYELEEPEFFMEEEKVPRFVPGELAKMIFETGKNIRFLREHHAEHPLARKDVVMITRPPRLEWKFDWEEISRAEEQARNYRDAVLALLQGVWPDMDNGYQAAACPSPSSSPFIFHGKSESELESHLLISIAQLNQPPSSPTPKDGLTSLIHSRLYQPPDSSPLQSNALSPHWSLLPHLSFSPLLTIQSALVSSEVTKALFTTHNLRIHLDLLHQTFLLGNGMLCSRLSHALFDPNLDPAGSQGNVMGLRLAGGRTWPPKLGELRLVLMGVLGETVQPFRSSQTQPGNFRSSTASFASTASQSRKESAKLPGDLSFMTRTTLTEEEIRLSTSDADALEALDFLRIAYKAPAPLRPVLTPVVLAKFDRIFRLLLRVLRMGFVAGELLARPTAYKKREGNAALRFRFEARRFIQLVMSYFWSIAIERPWKAWEEWLDKVEGEVLKSHAAPQLQAGKTMTTTVMPDEVRARLEGVLDEMLTALLLRKRQAQVMGVLEDVFKVVLRFAKSIRDGPSPKNNGRAALNNGDVDYEGMDIDMEINIANTLTTPTPAPCPPSSTTRTTQHPINIQNKSQEEEDISAEALYPLFQKKVELFVAVCKGLIEKAKNKGEEVEISPLEQLVAMLDLDGFYSKRRRGGGGVFVF